MYSCGSCLIMSDVSSHGLPCFSLGGKVGSYIQLESLGEDEEESRDDPAILRAVSILMVLGLGMIPPLVLYFAADEWFSPSYNMPETSTAT